MTTNFILWSVINTVVWYATIYYALHAIKNEVNLYQASFVLLMLFNLSLITCPFMQPMLKERIHQESMMGFGSMMGEGMEQ